ncbi:MAG: hypothetical protein A2V66_15505 [Ignavibacteria bacterium RBG_13_36_8]|nr:MAG: hypothetical protein A2V66_15505 [Ignavibacteria bacterium RBG_13_36_8]
MLKSLIKSKPVNIEKKKEGTIIENTKDYNKIIDSLIFLRNFTAPENKPLFDQVILKTICFNLFG